MIPDTWYMPLLFVNTVGVLSISAMLFLIWREMSKKG